MLMEFQTSVEWVPASADFMSISPPSSVRVRNLREHKRVNLNRSCVFRPYQMDGSSRPHPEQAGTILDISKGGMSLASDRRLPSGYLAVELQDAAELQLQADLAVRYSRQPTGEKPFFRAGLQMLLIDREALSNLELFIDMELMRGSKTKRENGRE
jgi:c-di-GMP-binding flagellar brake protein YcgR